MIQLVLGIREVGKRCFHKKKFEPNSSSLRVLFCALPTVSLSLAFC